MAATDARRRFASHIEANVRYWLQRTQGMAQLDASELEADRQNLWRAVRFGLAYRHPWPETAELLLQSWLFIERRRYWREWIPFLAEAVPRCSEDELALKCRLLNRLGQAQRLDRQWQTAVITHQEALAIAAQIDDALLVARAHYFLSSAYLHQNDFAAAERHGLEALAAYKGHAPGSKYQATTFNELGQIARWQGDLVLAESHYQEAIACWRQLEDIGELAVSLINLAETLTQIDRFAEALAYYDEAISLLTMAGSAHRKVLVQSNLGALYYRMGDYGRAEATFREIDLAYLRQTGDIHFQAMVANGLGNVLLKQRRLEASETYLRQSLALWRMLDDEINLANTMGTLAETLAAKGEAPAARPLYQEACRLLAAYPDHVWARNLLTAFTEASAGLG